MKVQQGSIVTFHYTILDEDGEVVETSRDDEPVQSRWGDGELLVGVERALEGVEPGAQLSLTLEPEDAFGDYDPEGIFSIPREEIPGDEELHPGEWISMVLEPEEGEEGEAEEHEARIVSVGDGEVILDMNHPYAGKPVRFELEVLDVSTEG